MLRLHYRTWSRCSNSSRSLLGSHILMAQSVKIYSISRFCSEWCFYEDSDLLIFDKLSPRFPSVFFDIRTSVKRNTLVRLLLHGELDPWMYVVKVTEKPQQFVWPGTNLGLRTALLRYVFLKMRHVEIVMIDLYVPSICS